MIHWTKLLLVKKTYMQLNSARREAHSHKMRIERKLEEKDPEIESWLSVNSPFIPVSSKNNVKSQIMRKVKQEIEGNRDVDVEDILSILPSGLQSYIQSFTTLSKLKTVSSSSFLSGRPNRCTSNRWLSWLVLISSMIIWCMLVLAI